jgi:hypothetical protein
MTNGHPRTQAAADINKNAASLHLREKSWPAVVLSPIKLLSRPDLPPSAVPIRRMATRSQAIWGWCRWKSPVGSGDGDIQKQRPIPGTIRTSDCKIAEAQNEPPPRNVIQLKTDFRRRPHPLAVDEGDDGDWSIADKSGQLSQVVELLLAGRSQNSKATKTFETGAFVLWRGRLH